jgi:hypothetical protein
LSLLWQIKLSKKENSMRPSAPSSFTEAAITLFTMILHCFGFEIDASSAKKQSRVLREAPGTVIDKRNSNITLPALRRPELDDDLADDRG